MAFLRAHTLIWTRMVLYEPEHMSDSPAEGTIVTLEPKAGEFLVDFMINAHKSGSFQGELNSTLKKMSSENHLKTLTLHFTPKWISVWIKGVASQHDT